MTDHLLVKVLYEDEVAIPFENCPQHCTVNSEIFARVLFSRNFADAEFRVNKPSRNGEITLSFTNLQYIYSAPKDTHISSSFSPLIVFILMQGSTIVCILTFITEWTVLTIYYVIYPKVTKVIISGIPNILIKVLYIAQ